MLVADDGESSKKIIANKDWHLVSGSKKLTP